MNRIICLVAVTSIGLFFGLTPTLGDEPSKGSPAEQVAAIRAQLDSARADYVRKLQKASTTDERNQLMKEVPNSEPFAEQMLHARRTQQPVDLRGADPQNLFLKR
jgi:hypothetical protein